jgi:hypothetical protein
MTEQVIDNGLEWLKHNVNINREKGFSLLNLEVEACDWNHYINFQNMKEGISKRYIMDTL